MNQPIADYMFKGPLEDISEYQGKKGIIAITCSDGKKTYLIDVYFSKKIRIPRKKECWEKNKIGELSYAVLSDINLTDEQYESIIQDIRETYKEIPC
jgi:hypothetical protein